MAQTDSRTAVYKLHVSLRVPVDAEARAAGTESHFRWLPQGSTATADELDGLVVPALEASGFLEKVSEPQIPCERCQEDGTKKQKDARYASSEELAAHYAKEHPALAPPEEV